MATAMATAIGDVAVNIGGVEASDGAEVRGGVEAKASALELGPVQSRRDNPSTRRNGGCWARSRHPRTSSHLLAYTSGWALVAALESGPGLELARELEWVPEPALGSSPRQYQQRTA